MTDAANAEQADYWSTGGGLNWVSEEDRLDQLFENVTNAVIKTAGIKPGQTVLDIGCGTGHSTRAAAQAAGADGSAFGVDISTTLLARAKERALPNSTFKLADAQSENLPLDHFDHVISRFGVMFFADPVAAFKNLSSALKPDGKITMACWAPFKINPWFTIPYTAATKRLGKMAPMDPREPGPFAFADTDYVLGTLHDAGLTAQASTHEILLTLPGDAQNAGDLSNYVGPADRLIRGLNGTAEDKAAIIAATIDNLKPYEANGAVSVPAHIHFYTATK